MSIEFVSLKSNKDYFEGLVGLVNTKRRLSFYINNANSNGLMPNILLSSSKGTGKSTIARMIAAGLNRTLVEVNSAELKTLDDFFGVINLYVSDKKVTLFLDETENLSEEVAISLLTILNPNKENLTKYNHNQTDYLFDFKKLNVILASTESQQIHHALVDRVRVIDFDDYTQEDLKQIILNNLKEYKIENGILDRIVLLVRSNPRQAQTLSNDLLSFLKSRELKELTGKEWLEFYREMGLFELGLQPSEIKLLKILRKYPNSSLTRVASMMNQTPESTRRMTELYPLKMGLIEVRPATGRRLTIDGNKYVESIKD